MLQKAWPIYSTFAGVLEEQFAWHYSGTDGGTPRVSTVYLGAPNFACSNYLVQYVSLNGYLPTTAPVGCPAPVATTVCKKLFVTENGFFPDGNVFNCATSGNIASSVAADLSKLGGTTPSTPIRQRFNTIQSNVYLFDTQAAYATAFTNAGQPNFGTGTPVVAGTYPNMQMWYSIIFLNYFAGDDGEKTAYTASHELGHAFDDTFSPQDSSLAAFDTAVQHDWQTMDYVNFATGVKRNPCGTIAMDGYVGPFINVKDPSTAGMPNFCTGNVIEAKWAGKLTSDILRDPTVEGFSLLTPAFYQAAGASKIGYNPGYSTLAGWRELHAEGLAIRAKADIGSTPSDPIYYQMEVNGYYACIAGSSSWMQTEYTTGTTVPVASEPCQGALPGWVVIH